MTVEEHSGAANTWLMSRERRSLFISDWSMTEFTCALAMKHRRGHIDDGYRAAAERAWVLLSQEFGFISVTPTHFTQAAELADSQPRGLRAGDALHLAIAIDGDCQLATFDRDLADAAQARGIVVHPG